MSEASLARVSASDPSRAGPRWRWRGATRVWRILRARESGGVEPQAMSSGAGLGIGSVDVSAFLTPLSSTDREERWMLVLLVTCTRTRLESLRPAITGTEIALPGTHRHQEGGDADPPHDVRAAAGWTRGGHRGRDGGGGGARVANQLATRRRDLALPTVSQDLVSLFHTGPARNKVTARPLPNPVHRLLLPLFAAYVLCLALVPCSDIGLHAPEAAFATVTDSPGSGNQDAPCDEAPADGDHHDECTPFCACACCGVHVVVTPRHHLPISQVAVAQATVRPMSAATAWSSRFLGSVSQPPRV